MSVWTIKKGQEKEGAVEDSSSDDDPESASAAIKKYTARHHL